MRLRTPTSDGSSCNVHLQDCHVRRRGGTMCCRLPLPDSVRHRRKLVCFEAVLSHVSPSLGFLGHML